MSIRTEMPVLARHEGDWEGDYITVDPDNTVIDRHKAYLNCRFPDSGPFAYHQTNTYVWPDGRREVNEFPAAYRDRQIHWDTDRIFGRAWEIDDRTVVLTWTRKDNPGGYFYEMIQLSADGNNRARTWHLFENDELVRRTCIKERRVK